MSNASNPFSLRVALFAGLVASLVMGMVEMVLEAVDGDGFWSPVVYIAATVLRDYQTVAVPVSFKLVPVLVGLMGHMMMSVMLGLAFAAVAPRIARGRAALIGLGILWSLIVFGMLWAVVLPLVDPVMLDLNPAYFIVAHMMWGAALGAVASFGATRARTANRTARATA